MTSTSGRLRTLAASAALLVCLGWSVTISRAATDVARPTPLHWEQWQPKIDTSDARVQRPVTLVDGDLTLAEALTALAESTGVKLTAMSELKPFHLSVCAEDRPLAELMVVLATLYEGHWSFVRGQEPEERTYCLSVSAPFHPSDPFWFYQSLSDWRESQAADWVLEGTTRAGREARLALYAQALHLDAAELLARYEETDPWLCADLLQPRYRQLHGLVSRLSEEAREKLVSSRDVVLPIWAFGKSDQRTLAAYVRGEWGDPGGRSIPCPDPDLLPRFSTPEERWQRAKVTIWMTRKLQVSVEIPDTGEYGDVIGRLREEDSPAEARWILQRLGYLSDTPERSAAIEAQQEAWRAAHPERFRDAAPEPADSLKAPEDARLSLPVLLPQGHLALSTVLEALSRQGGFPIVAQGWTDRDRDWFLWSDGTERSVGAVLASLRDHLGENLSWMFLGKYLVLQTQEGWMYREMKRLPEMVRVRAEEVTRSSPGGVVTLSELAELAKGLNPFQAYKLQQALGLECELPQALLHNLPIYAGLSAHQLERLQRGEAVAAVELPANLRAHLWWEEVCRWPWVSQAEADKITLTLTPRTYASGATGISLFAEYQAEDGHSDRRVLFCLPDTFTLPDISTDNPGDAEP